MAQKAELFFTWNKGDCILYSTKAKGAARRIWKALYVRGTEAVDLNQEIERRDTARERIDAFTGTHHTRLSGIRIGTGENGSNRYHG